MRKIGFSLVMALLAGLLAGGCATTASQSEQSAHATSRVDDVYMQQVERQARRSGVKVRWVNPPRKKQRDK